MKRIVLAVLVVLGVAACMLPLAAYADGGGGEPLPLATQALRGEQDEASYTYTLTYTYLDDGDTHTASVAGFEGVASGDLVIPATVSREGDDYAGIEYVVTSIESSVFRNKTEFTGNLVLPDSIVSINASAFEGCQNLVGPLILPANLKHVGASAFKGCSGLSGALDLPLGLVTLGEYAFYDCENLSGTVTIPAGVTEIGDYCFCKPGYSHDGNWQGITGIQFAEGSQLQVIGAYAFRGNWHVTGGIAIPENVISIGDYAFDNTGIREGSTNLNQQYGDGDLGDGYEGALSLPEGIQYIGAYAFHVCNFSGGLTIPNATVVLGENAFYDAGFYGGTLSLPEGMTEISDYCFFESHFGGTLALPNTLTKIGSNAFSNCSNFNASLTIPAGVTEIEDYAFSGFGSQGAPGLLVLPTGLKSIGDHAFSGVGCVGELVIPDSVETIGGGAFGACQGFTTIKLPDNELFTTIPERAFGSIWSSDFPGYSGSLVIPASVTTIEDYAFGHCANLTNVTFAEGSKLERIGENAFDHCRGLAGTLTLPSGLRVIDEQAFNWCDGLTGLLLPNTLDTIGEQAFFGCEAIGGDLVIPGSVKTIGKQAFGQFGCNATQTGTLTIENGVERIDDYAFNYCKNLVGTVAIPESLDAANVGRGVFQSCYGLTGFTLPSSWTRIPNSLFYGCTGLTGEFVLPSGITTIGESAFNGCSGYTGTLVIPDAVTAIGKDAFRNCSGFTAFELPSSWTSVPDGMFYGWEGLTGTLVIPAQITAIGKQAFYGCKNLTGTLSIPASVTTIGSGAFERCSGFTGSLTIPSSVTSIGDSAFQDCSGFTGQLVIPASVTSLGSGAFEFCSGFTGDVAIPSSITSLPRYLFYGCLGLTGTLTIPESVTGGYYESLNNTRFSTIVNNSACGFAVSPIVYGTEDYYENSAGEKVSIIETGTFTRVVGSGLTDISSATVKVAAQTYTGKELKPEPIVTVGDTTLEKGTHYTVSYAKNTNAGTAVVTVTGIESAGFSGSKSQSFTIKPKSISPAVKLDATSYVYDGVVKTPAVTVKDGSITLRSGTDYSTSYASGRVNYGSYKVNVTMKGNYVGSASATFTIKKAANSLSVKGKVGTVKFAKLKKAKQSLSIAKCIKFASKGQGALTYEKKSGNKKIAISKKTGKVTVKKGLKKGTYKIKVRVNAAGTANHLAAKKDVTVKIRVK